MFTGPIILVIFIVLEKMVIFQSKGRGRFICKGLEVITPLHWCLMRECVVEPT